MTDSDYESDDSDTPADKLATELRDLMYISLVAHTGYPRVFCACYDYGTRLSLNQILRIIYKYIGRNNLYNLPYCVELRNIMKTNTGINIDVEDFNTRLYNDMCDNSDQNNINDFYANIVYGTVDYYISSKTKEWLKSADIMFDADICDIKETLDYIRNSRKPHISTDIILTDEFKNLTADDTFFDKFAKKLNLYHALHDVLVGYSNICTQIIGIFEQKQNSDHEYIINIYRKYYYDILTIHDNKIEIINAEYLQYIFDDEFKEQCVDNYDEIIKNKKLQNLYRYFSTYHSCGHETFIKYGSKVVKYCDHDIVARRYLTDEMNTQCRRSYFEKNKLLRDYNDYFTIDREYINNFAGDLEIFAKIDHIFVADSISHDDLPDKLRDYCMSRFKNNERNPDDELAEFM